MKIEVRCPSCSKIGTIEISEQTINNVVRGLLAVNVAENITCEHSFVAYVDKNMKIRDYMLADFQIELPEAISGQKVEEKRISETELLDTDVIKLNLPASLIAAVIKAIMFNKSAVIILDQDYLHKHVLNFFHYITQDSFNADVAVMTKDQFEGKKKDYKNSIVFEDNKITKDKNRIFDVKQLKIESRITQQFYANYESSNSLIVLKNELQKAFQLSKTIGNFIANYNERRLISSKIIIDNVKEIHGIKIQKPYLTFLLEIVKNYFNINVPELADVSNMLGTFNIRLR